MMSEERVILKDNSFQLTTGIMMPDKYSTKPKLIIITYNYK
jgi:hypothetical protein